MNLLQSLKTLVAELGPALEVEPYEEKGSIFLILKDEILGNPTRFLPVFQTVKMDDKFGLSRFLSLYNESVPIKDTCVRKPLRAGFRVDMVQLRAAVVKDFYHPAERELVDTCVAYLADHGWSKKQMHEELGVS